MLRYQRCYSFSARAGDAADDRLSVPQPRQQVRCWASTAPGVEKMSMMVKMKRDDAMAIGHRMSTVLRLGEVVGRGEAE